MNGGGKECPRELLDSVIARSETTKQSPRQRRLLRFARNDMSRSSPGARPPQKLLDAHVRRQVWQ